MALNVKDWLNVKIDSFCKKIIFILRKSLLSYKEHFFVNLPEGPKIIAPNHPTTIDPIMLLLLTKDPSYVLIWNTLFEVPFFGKIFSYLKHIPVDPKDGSKAYNMALEYLKNGKNIIVFPEGHLTSEEKTVTSAKTGAVRLAIETGVPIIPVGIGLFYSKIKKKDSNLDNEVLNTRFYGGSYVVNAGKPIYYKKNNQSKEEIKKLTNELMANIYKLKERSDVEVQEMLAKKAYVKNQMRKAFSFALYQLIFAIIVKY